MEIATVTSKGQITIPASIRKVLKLDKGDKVILEEDHGRIIMINASARHLNMDKLIFASEPVSTEEAVSDEDPFVWADDVVNGDRKINL